MILQLLVCQSATGKLEKQHSSLFNDCHVILGNCPLSILAFHYCSITSSKISPFILLTYLDTGNVFLYRIIPGAGGNRGLAATISRSVVDKYFPFVRAAGKSSRCTIRGDSTQSFLYGRWMKALCGIARRGGGGGGGKEKNSRFLETGLTNRERTLYRVLFIALINHMARLRYFIFNYRSFEILTIRYLLCFICDHRL